MLIFSFHGKISRNSRDGEGNVGCPCFGCKKNTENILHHDECLGWPKNSVKQKIISIDCKILAREM